MYAAPLTTALIQPAHQQSNDTPIQYIDKFLNIFGTKVGAPPVVFTDDANVPLVVSDALFTRDKSKPVQDQYKDYKVFQADREIYLPMLADTIKHPSEIWETFVQTQDGKWRLCRRYIGIYKDASGKIGGYAVFDNINGTWQGTTTFQPGNLDYLNKQRTGTLLFPKSIKK